MGMPMTDPATMATAPALELRGAAFSFGSGGGARDGGDGGRASAGLSDVSLTVAPGERLVLVGPSGVGKTTLLKGIAGLTPILAGRIHVMGADVTQRPPEARGAVYLHQSPVLFPHRTVAGNVAFPLEVRGVPRDEMARRVAEALDAVHLGGLAARRVGGLSGGERHRVALARAVVARPPLLLLDEPLAALDPGLRHEVRESILALQTRYAPGLILVTHDLADVGHLAHRVGVLLDGRLVQVATPEVLFRDPASLGVARFLGMGPEIEVVRDGQHWYHPALGRVAPMDGGLEDGAKGVPFFHPPRFPSPKHPARSGRQEPGPSHQPAREDGWSRFSIRGPAPWPPSGWVMRGPDSACPRPSTDRTSHGWGTRFSLRGIRIRSGCFQFRRRRGGGAGLGAMPGWHTRPP
jgi:ABC-type sugar transport system ATPase subunit